MQRVTREGCCNATPQDSPKRGPSRCRTTPQQVVGAFLRRLGDA